MGRVNCGGYTLPGDNLIIDQAGWQCTVIGDDGARCGRIATYVHRRKVEGKIWVAALCPGHYDAAGPEARA